MAEQPIGMGNTTLNLLFEEIVQAHPYAWQTEAFERLSTGNIPDRILAPTAAGKVMILPIWLAALSKSAEAEQRRVQRRLVFVVNRRVLVDEASRLAERLLEVIEADMVPGLRDALCALSASGVPLRIATLRGQHVDNALWAEDPTTPAIILATPDMIGSRLLFRGYGLGRNRAAMQAGLLGFDTLIVHDESHLAPAFNQLLRDVERRVVPAAKELGVLPMHAIQMSATDRTTEQAAVRSAIHCEPEADPALQQRMLAAKHLQLLPIEKASELERKVVEIVAEQATNNKAIAVFVTSPAEADKIAMSLKKQLGSVLDERIVVLTGTMRGTERDDLLEKAAWRRVSAARQQDDEATAVLIATSAGEIGIDLDADILICDSATLDRQIQRFGRANRRGKSPAQLYVAYAGETKATASMAEMRARCAKAIELLQTLPMLKDGCFDASPLALTRLREHPDYFDAIEPAPYTRELEDGVVNLFAATSYSLAELKAPDPALWIHGLEPADPEVELVWRILPGADLEAWLDVWPIHTRERVRLPLGKVTDDLLNELVQRARQHALPVPLWLHADGSILGECSGKSRPGKTLLIDYRLGGLSADGLPAKSAVDCVSDVSVRQFTDGRVEHIDAQYVAEDEHWQSGSYTAASLGELIAQLYPDQRCVWLDRDGESQITVWLHANHGHLLDGDEQFTTHKRLLDEHLSLTGKAAASICDRLRMPCRDAMVRAGKIHDAGKQWVNWQLAIGNSDLEHPLGKSGGTSFNVRLNAGYRHELGSLTHIPDTDPLVRHLVGAHHGHGRPAFPARALAHAGCATAAERHEADFDLVQQRFGPWGTAFLEALLKCADIMAETQASKLLADPEPDCSPIRPEPRGHCSEIWLPLDASNPGEFLAALGLLWLVSTEHATAQLAWQPDGARLTGVDESELLAALTRLAGARTQTDDEHAAQMLKKNPGEKYPPLRLGLGDASYPINAWCRETLAEKSSWRFSAGRSDGLETLRNLLAQCRASLPLQTAASLLNVAQVTGIKGMPSQKTGDKKSEAQRFRLDAHTSWSAIDVGWSPYAEGMAFSRPWVEVLALLGIQSCFLPPWRRDDGYATWLKPRSINQAALAARGLTQDTLAHYAPHFVASGQNTDTYISEPTLSKEGTPECPHIFVI